MKQLDLRHLLGEKKCTCEEYEEYVEERKPVENAPERSIENHKWMCGAVWREYKEFTRRSYKNDVVGHQNHPVYKRLYARGKATLDEYDEYFNTCDQIRQEPIDQGLEKKYNEYLVSIIKIFIIFF